jgi:hypothetical protein
MKQKQQMYKKHKNLTTERRDIELLKQLIAMKGY